MLSHQDIILLTLLLSLDLSIKLADVLLLNFLTSIPSLLFLIVYVIDVPGDLVCIHSIVLARKILLGLLFLHLLTKCLTSVTFILVGLITFSLRDKIFSSFTFSHLPQHELLVPLGKLTNISLSLIVAERLVLGLIPHLVVLHLKEGLLTILLVLLHLVILLRSEDLVSILQNYLLVLTISLLRL